jgi:hypothetical protein
MYSPKETTKDEHELTRNMREETIASKKVEEEFASMRLEFMEDGTIHRIINAGAECPMPPPSPTLERVIAEKIALLKLAPLGKVIRGVGRRYTDKVYYIRIHAKDMRIRDDEV